MDIYLVSLLPPRVQKVSHCGYSLLNIASYLTQNFSFGKPYLTKFWIIGNNIKGKKTALFFLLHLNEAEFGTNFGVAMHHFLYFECFVVDWLQWCIEDTWLWNGTICKAGISTVLNFCFAHYFVVNSCDLWLVLHIVSWHSTVTIMMKKFKLCFNVFYSYWYC